MIVKSLELINFRNLKKEKVEFLKGINFLYGNNGSGKTSIVEGIYYLSSMRSFRTSKENLLINQESDYFQILAEICNDFEKNKLIITYDSKGKHIFLNGSKISKISELFHLINCLYFIPKDTEFFKGPPKIRRNFINMNISKIDTEYLKLLMNYEKLLKSRSDIFKKEKLDYRLINILTNQMIEISYKIYQKRKKYIEQLNTVLPTVFNKIVGKTYGNIHFKYLSFIDNELKYKKIAKAKYQESLEEDKIKKITTIGIHKEDYALFIDDNNIGLYGSQGENRLAILSLKLSPYYLIDNNKPIVILDDVLSELDTNNQNNLLNLINEFEQVFITSTTKISNKNINCNYFKLEKGKINFEGGNYE